MCFLNFFKIAVIPLGIHGNAAENFENMSETVEKAIKKIEFHQSISLTKNRIGKITFQN